jgi:predicted nucleotidyltransferase
MVFGEYMVNNKIEIIKKLIDLSSMDIKLNFPFIALIFGSYAKGTASEGADIDLMIISEKNRVND